MRQLGLPDADSVESTAEGTSYGTRYSCLVTNVPVAMRNPFSFTQVHTPSDASQGIARLSHRIFLQDFRHLRSEIRGCQICELCVHAWWPRR